MDNTIKVLNNKALAKRQSNDILPCECEACDACCDDAIYCSSDQPTAVWKLRA
jgi:hypothetical protein